MRLHYLKNSLEISRESFGSDMLTMWNVTGACHPCFPDGTTVTLETVKNIRRFGILKAAYIRLQEVA